MPRVFVEIRLSDFSQAYLDALCRLLNAVEHADQALLEDEIRDAHHDLVEVLRGDAPAEL